jgi:hypothetical protein
MIDGRMMLPAKARECLALLDLLKQERVNLRRHVDKM